MTTRRIPSGDYSLTQVAELTGLHVESVRRLVRAGRLQAYVVNPGSRRNVYRVTPQALSTFRQSKPAAETAPLPAAVPIKEMRPIWEIAVEIGAQIPLEEWKANVPCDASINVDHYLYGDPKRDE